MANLFRTFRLQIIGAAFILVALLLLVSSNVVQAEKPPQETEAYCLSCHSNPDLQMTLPSGETLPLYINQDELGHSVHSPLGIECEACHTEIQTYPHPPISYQTRRELSRSYYLSCKKCHSDVYDKAQDSMHAKIALEHPEAPVCTDCHSAHYVKTPDQPRSLVSTTCSNCHNDIYDQYKVSIHGAALIDDNNADVPVCTDCHGVHSIQDPRTVQFRVASPEMCAGCHANAELMNKYGLSADVYNLYELSWHGVDVTVYKSRWPTIWHESAVCTDCHGVHDILNTADPQSSVHPDNLLATCQKCHPGVSANWTSAWTGHYDISVDRTPLLFYVEMFYTSFTPVVLWGAAIYIFLQILRSLVDRARSSLQ